MSVIRPEQTRDAEVIRRVNIAAFGGEVEAALVERLRARGALLVSLVAESDGAVVGHIAFSRATLDGRPDLRAVGLGPMAVIPAMQRRGIGSALVRAGLDCCRYPGHDFAVVLGHPEYYPRFGFVPAARFGLRSIWDVPENVFMAYEFRAGALRGASGVVTYEPEFDLAADPHDPH